MLTELSMYIIYGKGILVMAMNIDFTGKTVLVTDFSIVNFLINFFKTTTLILRPGAF